MIIVVDNLQDLFFEAFVSNEIGFILFIGLFLVAMTSVITRWIASIDFSKRKLLLRGIFICFMVVVIVSSLIFFFQTSVDTKDDKAAKDQPTVLDEFASSSSGAMTAKDTIDRLSHIKEIWDNTMKFYHQVIIDENPKKNKTKTN